MHVVDRGLVPKAPIMYSTFQVARLLGVTPATIVNWVSAGLLTAWRTPGGHRRIQRDHLVEFARARAFPPLPELVDTWIAPEAPAISRRALVVDDEPDFCDMVRSYLVGRGGWEVEVAFSGFEAGVTVARFKPDVVLMDLLMPGMDGFDVLKMLRGDCQMGDVPVVACTAWRDPHVEQRIRRAAFHDCLQKPVKLDELAAVLEAAVRWTPTNPVQRSDANPPRCLLPAMG